MALQNLFASAAPLGEIYPQIAQICTDDAKNCSGGTAAHKGGDPPNHGCMECGQAVYSSKAWDFSQAVLTHARLWQALLPLATKVIWNAAQNPRR